MHVRHLSVVDFRSWPGVDLTLPPGPILLVGPNGQGKTNLLEALGYLATLGSHRSAGDAALVRAGAERAILRGAVIATPTRSGGATAARELRVEVEIIPGRANRAKLGNAAVPRVRDILGALRVVLFAPEDLAVVHGDPAERRRFLDDLAVARRPSLAGVRGDYERVLKQRATLLKSAGSAGRHPSPGQLAVLDAWDAQLAGFGAELLRARLSALRDLRPQLGAAWGQVAPGAAALTAAYRTTLVEVLPELTDPEAGPELDTLREALVEQISRQRAAELERGVNLVGPHRDDVELRLGQLPARGHASQGEAWALALALRLASYELLRADELPGGDPVLLLDDVFAHLDPERRAQLALVAGKAEQAIITAAAPGDVPDNVQGTRLRVSGGQVSADD